MLSPLETAAGFPLPLRSGAQRLPETALEPQSALEQAVEQALLRPPCVVSFSGGRDSSLVLSAAVAVARREGLPLPVPATVRVTRDDQSEEREWQELVVRHLGLDDWVRADIDDELDFVGPIARRVLLRHGLLWPENAHFHVPLLEHAASGSLLTGLGGDEIFSTPGWLRLRRILTGRARPRPGDALGVAAAIAPGPVRRRIVLSGVELEPEWLQPAAVREIRLALAAHAAAEPVRWRARFGWILGFRYLELGLRSLDVLGHDHDVELHHPLLAPMFVSALASLPRPRRFESRSEALTMLFGDLLPPGLATRSSKAAFDGTLWGDASRDFAARWDGTGVDPEIVDVDALRRRWQVERKEGPAPLLQWLWLEQARARYAPPSRPSSSSSTDGIAAQARGRRSSHAGSELS